MLALSHLNKSYRSGERAAPRLILNDLSLQLASGECLAVMGESGVGKSTLLNVIAGMESPDSGSVTIDGSEITAIPEPAKTLLRRAKVGFVFQAFHLLPYLSVAGNVALPLMLNGATDIDARVRAMLAAVGLEGRGDSPTRELSGGQAQRVAVARALIHKPSLVLADEPTGNLDAESAAQVLQLLRNQAKQQGSALLLVTHSQTASALMDSAVQLTAAGLRPL